ncbi:hypothetical protein B2J93_190 [Marssonina coronariae]|uniref:BTB domain-containing protein n=1 Tax=Diplocarpon coronariae TaxID=2795749 RepID=A0A218ZBV9_9HELO|nr:hypothetical protein B2J93_190 [Marssonina coronariae]
MLTSHSSTEPKTARFTNMNELSAIDRRNHAELQPLRTRSDSPYTPPRRCSRQGSAASIKQTPSLPSPSIVAARAYFLENATSLGNLDAQQRRRSLVEGQQFPRRHSILTTTKSLEVQLESFNFGAEPSSDLQTVPEADEVVTKMNIEEEEDVPMLEADDGSNEDDTASLSNSSKLCGTPQEALRQVPFQYTHDHLRDWGYAYLGNAATADAYINAVSMRRPSMAVGLSDDTEVRRMSELTTIRARVVPNGKDRKPFLIQRQFDIEELRSSIPKVPATESQISSASPRILRRSSRARRSSAQHHSTPTLRPSTPASTSAPYLGNGSLPIHIEYALHYLPVLGALMLSGHVRKGDSIDLPLPAPEAWRDVLAYIYTGRGSLTPAMRENVCFLAGHA